MFALNISINLTQDEINNNILVLKQAGFTKIPTKFDSETFSFHFRLYSDTGLAQEVLLNRFRNSIQIDKE